MVMLKIPSIYDKYFNEIIPVVLILQINCSLFPHLLEKSGKMNNMWYSLILVMGSSGPIHSIPPIHYAPISHITTYEQGIGKYTPKSSISSRNRFLNVQGKTGKDWSLKPSLGPDKPINISSLLGV